MSPRIIGRSIVRLCRLPLARRSCPAIVCSMHAEVLRFFMRRAPTWRKELKIGLYNPFALSGKQLHLRSCAIMRIDNGDNSAKLDWGMRPKKLDPVANLAKFEKKYKSGDKRKKKPTVTKTYQSGSSCLAWEIFDLVRLNEGFRLGRAAVKPRPDIRALGGCDISRVGHIKELCRRWN